MLLLWARVPKSKTRNPKSKISSLSLRVRHPEEAVPSSFTREDILAARLRVAKVIPYQGSRTPFISNLSLAVCSGLLLIFAFPDWNLWSLGWVGAAPLIMAVVREQRFWRSLVLGWVTGTIFYAGTSYWVTHSMHNYGEIPLVLSYVLLTILASILGFFTGIFAGATAIGVKRFGGWAMLAAPFIWAASEWARQQVTGVGWNALGYSQSFQTAAIQTARFGGVYIVSALLVAASTALVFAVVYLERRRGVIVLTAFGVMAIAAVVYGQSIKPVSFPQGSVPVVAVQPNIPIAGAWDDPNFIEQMLARHITLSERAIQSHLKERSLENSEEAGVELVIWPESPMNLEYERDAELRRRVADFTKRNNVFLLMSSWGGTEAGGALYNSAMVIAPSGERISRYDKIALVPFGEYVPARGWIPFMDRIPALVADVAPGVSFTVSDVAGSKIGTAICFEATRPDIARRFRSEGVSALVQISNELWFGPGSAPRQMLQHAIFRAVENDVDMIRVTNSGLSARVNSYGVVEAETPGFQTDAPVWRMKTVEEASRGPLTFYTRHGDVFAVTCAVLSLLFIVASVAPFNLDFNRRGRRGAEG
ncbi:MAG TPA: apolipoprotein N-acyltransferase [Blastocatellia bacterium]|nr:apolipoprotein N-acyltransferase [Blastocatellia bacterium]